MKKSLLLLLTIFIFQLKAQQPLKGPAGTDSNVHASFDSAFYDYGANGRFWIFQPKSPTLDSAFVVSFWHGSGYNSSNYRGYGRDWATLAIEIVKKGYVVVLPQYETSSDYDFAFSTVLGSAFAELNTTGTGHPKTRKNKNGKVAYGCIGFSLGGMMLSGANKVGNYNIIDYPMAMAAFAPYGLSQNSPYNNIPSSTKVSIQIGDKDFNPAGGGLQNQAINMHYNGLTNVPCHNKVVMTITSISSLGDADHLYPLLNTLNAYDYYGTFKQAIGIMDCAMKNKNCEYVLTNRDSITYMGKTAQGIYNPPIKIAAGACSATGLGKFITSFNVIQTPSGNTITTQGGTMRFRANVAPAGVDTSITWNIQPSNLAKISSSGILKAVGNGTVTLTGVSNANNVYKRTFVITMSNQYLVADSVKLEILDEETYETLGLSISGINRNVIFNPTFYPEGAGYEDITYSIFPDSIGSISNENVLTILKYGTVTVNTVFKGVNTISSSIVLNIVNQNVSPSVTGINESFSRVSIFPNPSNGKVHVEIPKGVYQKCTIINTNGIVVWTQTIKANTQLFDIELPQKGLYIIDLSSHKLQKSIRKKLVVE
jgi:hypothetical protein